MCVSSLENFFWLRLLRMGAGSRRISVLGAVASRKQRGSEPQSGHKGWVGQLERLGHWGGARGHGDKEKGSMGTL